MIEGHNGLPSERMASKSKKDPLAALMSLPGIGKATAKKLSDAGIKSASGIKKAGKKGLMKAGLSLNMSEKLLKTVNKGQSVKAAAKSAAKKVKSTAKTATKKTKSTASKAVASSKKVAQKTVSENDGSKKVKFVKSTDGRKGKTLKIPRSVKDMAWFKKD